MRTAVSTITYYVAEVRGDHSDDALISCGHQHVSRKSAAACAKRLKARVA